MFDMFDSNNRCWFMRLMDEEVEGTVVEVEGMVEEVEVELVSAIVGPWDRGCSDTMKRFNLSYISCTNGVHTIMRKKLPTQREKRESNLGTREEENSDEKEMIFLTVHYSEVQYIYIHKDQLWPYQRSLNLRDWSIKCGESLGA